MNRLGIEELNILASVFTALAILAWLMLYVKPPKLKEARERLSLLGVSGEENRALDKRLKGLNIPLTGEMFSGIRMTSVILFAVLGAVYLMTDINRGVLFLFLSVLSLRLPYRLLEQLEAGRKDALERDFAAMVSQVRIFSKAADLYQALKIASHASKGVIGKEMRLLSVDLEMTPIHEALDGFAKRCGLKEAESFSQIVLVGIRTGVDINDILSSYSKMIKDRRKNKIKRWIKLQPVVITVLPALLLGIFILMWVIPMYSNIISRLKLI